MWLCLAAPAASAADIAEGGSCADPFKEDGIIPRGKYKGRAIDTDDARSASRLDEAQAAPYGSLHGRIVAANFQHGWRGEGVRRFWVAFFPAGGVEDVILQREHIPDGNGHGQIRFRMRKPILLVEQSPCLPRQTVELDDFIFTANGTPPKGVVSQRQSGDTGSDHLMSYRMMSMPDAVAIMSAQHGSLHSVDQYRLDIPHEAKQRIFEEALATATREGLRKMFNLIDRSCVGEAMSVLDRAVVDRYGWEATPRKAAAMLFNHNPEWIPFYLNVRGIPYTELGNLREEFPDTKK